MEQPNDLKKILSTDNINELDDSPKKQYNSLDSMTDLLNMVDNERSNIENKPWSKIDKVNKNSILKTTRKSDRISVASPAGCL